MKIKEALLTSLDYNSNMQKELSYLTPEGYTVFTSQFLKNKGTCCKSACLHCPYGYTLKKHGLEFSPVSSEDFSMLDEIMAESGVNGFEWKTFLPDNVLLMRLKGVVCGFLVKNHIVVKQVFLKSRFQHQGLSKDLIESYLFI
jgi:hypothetical protein